MQRDTLLFVHTNKKEISKILLTPRMFYFLRFGNASGKIIVEHKVQNGYIICDNQAKLALQRLIGWIEKQLEFILHAAKQEVILHEIRVDGFHSEAKQVFQFQGCLWHDLKRNEILNTRYESTVVKNERLKNFGYHVTEMWVCSFRHNLKNKKEISDYTDNHPLLVYTPLNLRDVFYGARTDNTKTYYKVKPGEKSNIWMCALFTLMLLPSKRLPSIRM